jgi:putative sterol carrier protein
MRPYQDTEHLYKTLQQLFEQLEQYNPTAAADFSRSRLIVRLNTTEPEGVVVLNGRTTPITTLFGEEARLRPDLDITLTANALHQILLGELSLTKALGQRDLQVKGSIFKATALANLFRQSQSIYPQLWNDQRTS